MSLFEDIDEDALLAAVLAVEPGGSDGRAAVGAPHAAASSSVPSSMPPPQQPGLEWNPSAGKPPSSSSSSSSSIMMSKSVSKAMSRRAPSGPASSAGKPSSRGSSAKSSKTGRSSKSSSAPSSSSGRKRQMLLTDEREFSVPRGDTLPSAPRGVPMSAHPLLDYDAAQHFVYPSGMPPRRYQYDIVKRCLVSNTMVVLPTGLGKTFVASCVILNFQRWFPEGKIVFMAPTKPLVAQQVAACYNVAGVRESDIAELTGETSAPQRRTLWASRRVFFATPQTLLNDINRGSCNPDRFVLVIVDEAHRATRGYAYGQVVHEIAQRTPMFRVLALTATPGADLSAIASVIKTLRISTLEARDETSPDVRPYTHIKTVEVIKCASSAGMNRARDVLLHLLGRQLGRLCDAGAYYERDPARAPPFGILSGMKAFQSGKGQTMERGPMMGVIGDFGTAHTLARARDLLERQGAGAALTALVNKGKKSKAKSWNVISSSAEFKKVLALLGGDETPSQKQRAASGHGSPRGDAAGAVSMEHPKVQAIKNVVTSHFTATPDAAKQTRVMIFTQMRESVATIMAALLELEAHGVRPFQFVGHGSTSTKGLTGPEQAAIIRKFRRGTYNTLVATSIGEEGLDIGEVDLVIAWDAVASPLRMVQRMGRTGRKREGRVVLLVAEGAEANSYERGQDRHRQIQNALQRRTDAFAFFDGDNRLVPSGINPEVLLETVEPTTPLKKRGGRFGVPAGAAAGGAAAQRKSDRLLAEDLEFMENFELTNPNEPLLRPDWFSAHIHTQSVPSAIGKIGHSRLCLEFVRVVRFIADSSFEPDDAYESTMEMYRELAEAQGLGGDRAGSRGGSVASDSVGDPAGEPTGRNRRSSKVAEKEKKKKRKMTMTTTTTTTTTMGPRDASASAAQFGDLGDLVIDLDSSPRARASGGRAGGAGDRNTAAQGSAAEGAASAADPGVLQIIDDDPFFDDPVAGDENHAGETRPLDTAILDAGPCTLDLDNLEFDDDNYDAPAPPPSSASQSQKSRPGSHVGADPGADPARAHTGSRARGTARRTLDDSLAGAADAAPSPTRPVPEPPHRDENRDHGADDGDGDHDSDDGDDDDSLGIDLDDLPPIPGRHPGRAVEARAGAHHHQSVDANRRRPAADGGRGSHSHGSLSDVVLGDDDLDRTAVGGSQAAMVAALPPPSPRSRRQERGSSQPQQLPQPRLSQPREPSFSQESVAAASPVMPKDSSSISVTGPSSSLSFIAGTDSSVLRGDAGSGRTGPSAGGASATSGGGVSCGNKAAAVISATSGARAGRPVRDSTLLSPPASAPGAAPGATPSAASTSASSSVLVGAGPPSERSGSEPVLLPTQDTPARGGLRLARLTRANERGRSPPRADAREDGSELGSAEEERTRQDRRPRGRRNRRAAVASGLVDVEAEASDDNDNVGRRRRNDGDDDDDYDGPDLDRYTQDSFCVADSQVSQSASTSQSDRLGMYRAALLTQATGGASDDDADGPRRRRRRPVRSSRNDQRTHVPPAAGRSANISGGGGGADDSDDSEWDEDVDRRGEGEVKRDVRDDEDDAGSWLVGSQEDISVATGSDHSITLNLANTTHGRREQLREQRLQEMRARQQRARAKRDTNKAEGGRGGASENDPAVAPVTATKESEPGRRRPRRIIESSSEEEDDDPRDAAPHGAAPLPAAAAAAAAGEPAGPDEAGAKGVARRKKKRRRVAAHAGTAEGSAPVTENVAAAKKAVVRAEEAGAAPGDDGKGIATKSLFDDEFDDFDDDVLLEHAMEVDQLVDGGADREEAPPAVSLRGDTERVLGDAAALSIAPTLRDARAAADRKMRDANLTVLLGPDQAAQVRTAEARARVHAAHGAAAAGYAPIGGGGVAAVPACASSPASARPPLPHPCVFVAERELKVAVCSMLRSAHGLRTVVRTLPTAVGGAYIVGEDCAVERRTRAELLRCADDPDGPRMKSLRAHVSSLLTLYPRGAYLIVESDANSDVPDITNVHDRYVASKRFNDLMLTLAMVPGLRLLTSGSIRESSLLVSRLAEHCTGRSTALRITESEAELEAARVSRQFLVGLPGVSWPRAYQLTREHGTLAAIIAKLTADPSTPAARALLHSGTAGADEGILDIDGLY